MPLPSGCKADTTNDPHSLNFSTILTGCKEQMLLGFDCKSGNSSEASSSPEKNDTEHKVFWYPYLKRDSPLTVNSGSCNFLVSHENRP